MVPLTVQEALFASSDIAHKIKLNRMLSRGSGTQNLASAIQGALKVGSCNYSLGREGAAVNCIQRPELLLLILRCGSSYCARAEAMGDWLWRHLQESCVSLSVENVTVIFLSSQYCVSSELHNTS